MQTDWDDLKWRIGHFWLSRQLIEIDPDAILALFSKMIVVRCEHHYVSDRFEYIAISPLFEKIADYIAPLDYIFEYDSNTREVKARRDNAAA